MFTKKPISYAYSMFALVFLLVLIFSAPNVMPAQAAGIRYAKPAASGTGDCSSWANACTLQTALTGAISGDELWVKAGTHKPTTGTDHTATFQLKSGVPIYGGFAGTETERTQRNPAVNVTILSGDLKGDDNSNVQYNEPTRADNSSHVVTGATGATLDGFTITAGNANNNYPNDTDGGGMYNANGSSPVLTNVTFSGNSAWFYGGGMSNWQNSNPTLTNVTFSGNSAYLYGGGMYNSYSGPTLTNVTFGGNSTTYISGYGGGMYNDGSNPSLTNVTFSSNSAGAYGDGGGMSNWHYSSPTLTNVTFRGNSAGGGSGMDNNYSNPTLTNVTFSDNSARGGGGMDNNYSSPEIRNTIFWGNTDLNPGIRSEINNDSSSHPVVSDSVVQGGCPEGSTCTNIIIADPKLGPFGSYGGFTRTVPLLPGSSAIDAGNDTTCPVTDQRGVSRPQGAHCDIGAYEDDHTIIPYILYTKPAASGTGDCSSWTNACILQTALTGADHGNEIWVAAGTYKPTTVSTDLTATFQLKNGVDIYGGFAGTETARDQRNPATHLTILSGDIDNNDSQTPIITDLATVTGNTTNSKIIVSGAPGAIHLDGFTITAAYGGAGMSNGDSSPTVTDVTFSGNSGGGMYNNNSSPTLTDVTFSGNSADFGGGMANWQNSSPTLMNVTFSGNSATGFGGGMFNYDNSSPTLTNVTFSGNTATSYGGGMYDYDNSSPTLTNVTFSSNAAGSGGGMYNDNSSPMLTNVTFSGNSATNTGGGMANTLLSNPLLTNVTFSDNSANYGGGMENDYGSAPTLTNVTFSGNSASYGGGMANIQFSLPWLTNVTFSSNSATIAGGGMYIYAHSKPLIGNITIRNTIFWGNTAPGAGAQIHNNDIYSTPVLKDSIVQGGCPAGSTCTNIITANPLLGVLGNYGGSTLTIPLLPGSSAIDTGNDVVCPATDQRGLPRPQPINGHCDIGAYEAILYQLLLSLSMI